MKPHSDKIRVRVHADDFPSTTTAYKGIFGANSESVGRSTHDGIISISKHDERATKGNNEIL
jgi:hypothetical protein